jgi:hypothetical protein
MKAPSVASLVIGSGGPVFPFPAFSVVTWRSRPKTIGAGVNHPPDRLSQPFIPTGIENFAATFCEEPAQLSDPPLLPI